MDENLSYDEMMSMYTDVIESPETLMAAKSVCGSNMVLFEGNCCTPGTYRDIHGNLTGGACMLSM